MRSVVGAVDVGAVLRSLRDGKRYVGMAADPGKRLEEHNRGCVQSTRGRRPFVLVVSEECQDHRAARVKEKYYKSAAGRRTLDALEKLLGPVAQRIEQQPSKL
jgi:putative endonuclease